MAEDYNITKDNEIYNLAEDIEEDTLNSMAKDLCDTIQEDLDSRSEWEEKNDEWLKLAAQVMEDKDFPWPNAANVKYPLLSQSSLQFHARAYPALVNEAMMVKARILGDKTDEKVKRGNRVRQHMSYQLLHGMKNWQEDMDRLLYILPITGLAYKKTYFSPAENANVSPLVLPRDLIINYHATSYERATKTHRMYKDENEIIELINAGIYLDIDLTEPEQKTHDGVQDEITGLEATGSVRDDTPYEIYECHTTYDLDGDGYKEPVIITIIKDLDKVVRIVNRYGIDDMEFDGEGDLIKINPVEYFTAFKFLPNPESAIYALGFGALLGPINKAVNTTINQLLDAGTLSNMQAGFLSKGVRMRGGNRPFRPGEWRATQTTGDDLRKGIFPLPVREPSGVLFNLLGMLVEAGERLSSVKDIMVGDNPGQNQPYATTQTVLEQGMKVFVGIYKRIYRALGEEYRKLYRLNGLYLDDKEYFDILDLPKMDKATGIVTQDAVYKEDYTTEGIDILPGADPNIMSKAEAQMRANSLLEKAAAGMPLNMMMVTRKVLEAEEHEDIEELMTVPKPQPDPEIVLKMEEFKHKREYEWAELQANMVKNQYENLKDYSQAMANMAKAAMTEQGVEESQIRLIMDQLNQEHTQVVEEMGAISQFIQSAANAEQPQQRGETPQE